MEEVNGNVRDVLQTTLNNSQSLSPKLAGMVRRFKAVTTLLMMRRDAAYADLDTYTKRLHSWVDEFDETMRTSIKVAFSGLLLFFFFLDFILQDKPCKTIPQNIFSQMSHGLQKNKNNKNHIIYLINASSASVESIIDIYNTWRQTAILKKKICLSYTDLKSEKAKALLL